MKSNLKLLAPNEVGTGILTEVDGYIRPQKSLNEENENWDRTTRFDVNNPYVTAVLQKYGVLNRNGRVYPEHILRREVNKYQSQVKMGTAVGEKSHPDYLIVETANIAIVVTETWWEGATLLGKIKLPISEGFKKMGIISCPADHVANLIMNDVLLGVSSRGVGTVVKKKDYLYVEDFELICWDVVTNPSTIGAWMYNNPADTKPNVDMHPRLQENERPSDKPLLDNNYKNHFDTFLSNLKR